MKKTVALLFAAFYSLFVFSQSDVQIGPEQKVKAEIKIPAAVKPGSDFTVVIKITKGNVSGLGRLQQVLPKGMTAAQLENTEADFSVDGQNIKYIWVNLPQQQIITVKYKVSTEATLSGIKTFSGTFSYVENGKTKTYKLVPAKIRLDPNAPQAEVVAENTQPEQAPEQTQPVATPVEHGTEIIPPLPTDTNPAQKNSIEQKDVEVSEQKPAEQKVPTPSAEKEKVQSAVAEKKEIVNPGATNATGIIFRVQIAAMHEKHYRRDGHFQKAFDIEQTVYKEEHEGLKKYTVGNFSVYRDARAMKNEIISKVEGAFVVAYNDGVRIPVPEALHLMKQK